MRITKKQREEVEYLSHFAKIVPSQEEVCDFIGATVLGKPASHLIATENRLRLASQRITITYKLWKEDRQLGLLFKQDFVEDPDYHRFPYYKRLVDRVFV